MANNLGNKKTMSDNIKFFMLQKGVSATEVCKALDVPESTFSYWLNCKTYPRIDKIEKMANYFGITKADLVEERTQTNYYEKVSLQFFAGNEKPSVVGELCDEERELIEMWPHLTDDVKRALLTFARSSVKKD